MDFSITTKKDAAILYAKMGLNVFPVLANRKVPMSPNGFKDSTSDPMVVEEIWTENPDANIGLYLAGSGLVALDADTYKDDYDTELPEFPETWTQTTPQDGVHYIFKDCGQEYSGHLKLNEINQPCIDIKHKGYVLLAPSSIDEVCYQASNINKPVDAPEWFRIGAQMKKRHPRTSQKVASSRTPVWSKVDGLLAVLNPDMDYNDWVSVLMGLHHETEGSVAGMLKARDWSAKGHKYKEGEVEQKWNSFDADGSVTLGTLVHLAKDNSLKTFEMSKSRPAGSMLARAGDIPLSHPEFVVNDLLEQEAISMIFGKSFSGKTFVSIDLGLSCAAGFPFYGHDVKAARPVVYAAAEGKNGLLRRCYAWCEKRGLELSVLPFYISQLSVPISDDSSVERLTAEIDDISEKEGKPGLIVFDTLNRSIPGWAENSADDMGKLLQELEKLAKRYECNVCLVHHTGHENTHRGRGSSSLYAGMDQSFEVSQKHDIVTLKCDKMKDGETPDELQFRIIDTEFEYGGESYSAARLEHEPNVPKIAQTERLARNEAQLDKVFQELADEGKGDEGCFDKELVVEKARVLWPDWPLGGLRKFLTRVSKVHSPVNDMVCTNCGR